MGVFNWLFKKVLAAKAPTLAGQSSATATTDRHLNEEEAFIAAILSSPDETVTHLVYADWLEERGDPASDYVRQAVAPIKPVQWFRIVECGGVPMTKGHVSAVLTTLKTLAKVLPRIERYEFSDLGDRLVHNGSCASKAEYAECFRELKRFLAICFVSKLPLGMSSRKIDAVWHQFILFTSEYSKFCDNTFGCYMHHSPYTGGDAQADTTCVFSRLYEQMFGMSPPGVWSAQSDAAPTLYPHVDLTPAQEGISVEVPAESEKDYSTDRSYDSDGNYHYDCGQHR